MEHPTLESNPSRRLEQFEALDAARSAIHSLNEPEREVFLMRTSAGLTFEATAEALGIPVGTAKTRMRHALLRLRAALVAHAPDRPCADRVSNATPTNNDNNRPQAPEVQR